MKKESLLKGGETKMLYWVLVKFKDTINLVFFFEYFVVLFHNHFDVPKKS